MFAAANQAQFTLALPGLAHDFKVLAFTGREAIGEPYSFEVELVCERPDLDLEALLHQPAYLKFGEGGIHGLIHRIAQDESGKRLTRYHLTLVPKLAYLAYLAYLAHRTNQRIFQHLTVPQILAAIFEEHGILAETGYRLQLGSEYPTRDYCMQYDKSDLHSLQRLCEEEGLHYHFQHSPDGHLLVFGDDQTVFPKLSRLTAYLQHSGLVADEPVIKRFALRLETRSGAVIPIAWVARKSCHVIWYMPSWLRMGRGCTTSTRGRPSCIAG